MILDALSSASASVPQEATAMENDSKVVSKLQNIKLLIAGCGMFILELLLGLLGMNLWVLNKGQSTIEPIEDIQCSCNKGFISTTYLTTTLCCHTTNCF